MKTKIQDSDKLVPDAEGDSMTGQIKTEITFLWAEADEWKPTGEVPEIAENTNLPFS